MKQKKGLVNSKTNQLKLSSQKSNTLKKIEKKMLRKPKGLMRYHITGVPEGKERERVRKFISRNNG